MNTFQPADGMNADATMRADPFASATRRW